MKKIPTKTIFLAPRVERIMNYVIDIAAVRAVVIAIQLPLVLNSFYLKPLGEILFLYIPVFFFYFTISEILFGKTLGKVVTKTRVVDLKGKKPTIRQLIIRSLVRCIPFEQFSFVFLPVGLHDSISNTRVVSTKKA
ncbi:MAG: RDD family protein [Candidatus Woesebacteria bacterium]